MESYGIIKMRYMNQHHTFISRTWGGNKPISTGVLITLIGGGFFLMLTLIGAPLGIVLFIVGLFQPIFNKQAICPSCKAKVSVFRNAKAFSCYNCQKVIVKKSNRWEIMPD